MTGTVAVSVSYRTQAVVPFSLLFSVFYKNSRFSHVIVLSEALLCNILIFDFVYLVSFDVQLNFTSELIESLKTN